MEMSKENSVTSNFIPSLNLTPSSEQLVIINNLLNQARYCTSCSRSWQNDISFNFSYIEQKTHFAFNLQ